MTNASSFLGLNGQRSLPYPTGSTQVDILICGEQFWSDLSSELANLSSGDIIYITDWLFSDFAMPGGSLNFSTQLATLASQNVDVRMLLWWLHPSSYEPVGLASTVGGLTDWLVTNFGPNNGPLAVGTRGNPSAADLLRKATPASSSQQPLQANVVLDPTGLESIHQKAIVLYSSSSQRLVAYLGGMDLRQDVILNNNPTNPTWFDVQLKLTGGAALDVYNNFAQRWGELFHVSPLPDVQTVAQTSSGSSAVDSATSVPIYTADVPAAPSTLGAISVSPTDIPSQQATIQVVRTFPKNQDPYGTAWHDSNLARGIFDIETCIVNAIANAKQFIYVEDQGLFFSNSQFVDDSVWGLTSLLPQLVNAAQTTGAKLILVAPKASEPGNQQTPSYGVIGSGLQQVASSCSIALFSTYLHSKVVIVDDVFAMVGSANFAARSLDGRDIEMSGAIYSPLGTGITQNSAPNAAALTTGSIVQDLRVKLWAFHFGYNDPLASGDTALATYLSDITQSLALWNPSWGTPPPASLTQPSNAVQLTNVTANVFPGTP